MSLCTPENSAIQKLSIITIVLYVCVWRSFVFGYVCSAFHWRASVSTREATSASVAKATSTRLTTWPGTSTARPWRKNTGSWRTGSQTGETVRLTSLAWWYFIRFLVSLRTGISHSRHSVQTGFQQITVNRIWDSVLNAVFLIPPSPHPTPPPAVPPQ